MKKAKAFLSLEDRRAVDAVLDHAAHARSSSITRLTAALQPQRVAAVNKLLHLLDELPQIDPPHDLVARTMARIDGDVAQHAARESQIGLPTSTHLH